MTQSNFSPYPPPNDLRPSPDSVIESLTREAAVDHIVRNGEPKPERRGHRMWWKRKHKTSVRRGTLTAFVDEGSEIEGKSSFSGTALLNGRFRGEVVSNDTLIIGERAVINATVRAATLIVNGEVTGTIEVTGRVELRASARVFGDVEAPVIVMDEGASLQGHCRVTKADATEPARDLAVAPINR